MAYIAPAAADRASLTRATVAAESAADRASLTRAEVAARAGIGLVAVAAVAAAVAGAPPALPTALVGMAALGLGVAATHRWLLAWRTLVGAIIAVILIIPIKRYYLPVHIGFQVEPYRLLVAGIGIGLVGSLLIDPAVRLRRTGLEAPILGLVGAIVLSIAVRSGDIGRSGLSTNVSRSVMFFLSYLAVFYIVTTAIKRLSDIDALLKLLVGCGAAVGLLAVVESRTGYNLFDHLQSVIPVLHFGGIPYVTDRNGARAYASAQHPIAMGAALMMLVPLAIYLFRRTGDKRWVLAFALLLMGSLATKSRTAVVMMLVILITMLVLKPRATIRVLPLLLPMVILIHVAMPGTIGTFKEAIFQSGVVAQETNAGASWHSNFGVGRIGEWGPALDWWSHTPFFGRGFGTLISDLNDAHYNAPILDDQWLGSLLELGLTGVAALLWFFIAAIRRLGRFARRDDSPQGWLLATITASVTAYTVGMLTFDAFNFVQVTLIVFILIGLGVVAIRTLPQRAPR